MIGPVPHLWERTFQCSSNSQFKGEMHAKIRWTLKRVICLLMMIMTMDLAFVCGGSSGHVYAASLTVAQRLTKLLSPRCRLNCDYRCQAGKCNTWCVFIPNHSASPEREHILVQVALYSKSDRELNSGSQIRSCPFSLHVRPSEKSYLSQHASDICTDIGHLRHDSLPGRTPAHSSETGSHPV